MFSWSQLGFQDALSPVMEEFIYFHDFTMVILTFILSLVSWTIMKMLVNLASSKLVLEGQVIECVWTLIPGIILVQIAIPSLILLYLMEDGLSADFTIKAIGHQWYWEYEYPELLAGGAEVSFDAYMLEDGAAGLSQFRLLDTDNRVVLPYASHIQVLVSSSDVLHSWALPSLGVKADASPGRVNQSNFSSYRSGLVFGQCSEICGANHSFMPISLEFVSIDDFMLWINLLEV